MERASHFHTVSGVQKTTLVQKTLQQPKSQTLAAALTRDARRCREIGDDELRRQGGRSAPETRRRGLCFRNPLSPERLMLRLLGWSVPAADHGVLEKFSHRDASFPA
jgi:hypothetical protein